MNTRPAVTFQRAAMVDESPTTAIARSSAPAASMALLQNGKVSIRPVSGLTRVSSWCSKPAWFSSEPRWWSTLNTTAWPAPRLPARAIPAAR